MRDITFSFHGLRADALAEAQRIADKENVTIEVWLLGGVAGRSYVDNPSAYVLATPPARDRLPQSALVGTRLPAHRVNLNSPFNPACGPALLQARNRANREQKACAVYVAAPNAPAVISDGVHNVWYVRLVDEPAPEGAELYRVIEPDNDL